MRGSGHNHPSVSYTHLVEERSGHGVQARIDEHVVLVGNDKLMSSCGIDFHDCELTGTILHVSLDGEYIGHIVIALSLIHI